VEATPPLAAGHYAQQDAQRILRALLQELPPAKAAKIAATICEAKKSDMYALALTLTNQQ
jgi:formate dehydrogenase maturation protein FdhE